MNGEENGHGKSRLDRLEGLMELLIDDHLKFGDEHKRLLTAQVLLADAQKQTEQELKELAERMNALIAVVDDLVRRPTRPQ